MSDAEQKYSSDKNNLEYASKYAIISREYYELVVILRNLKLWDTALKYCVDKGTLDSDILKTDEEKEIRKTAIEIAKSKKANSLTCPM